MIVESHAELARSTQPTSSINISLLWGGDSTINCLSSELLTPSFIYLLFYIYCFNVVRGNDCHSFIMAQEI